jgi:hypothetical protein
MPAPLPPLDAATAEALRNYKLLLQSAAEHIAHYEDAKKSYDAGFQVDNMLAASQAQIMEAEITSALDSYTKAREIVASLNQNDPKLKSLDLTMKSLLNTQLSTMKIIDSIAAIMKSDAVGAKNDIHRSLPPLPKPPVASQPSQSKGIWQKTKERFMAGWNSVGLLGKAAIAIGCVLGAAAIIAGAAFMSIVTLGVAPAVVGGFGAFALGGLGVVGGTLVGGVAAGGACQLGDRQLDAVQHASANSQPAKAPVLSSTANVISSSAISLKQQVVAPPVAVPMILTRETLAHKTVNRAANLVMNDSAREAMFNINVEREAINAAKNYKDEVGYESKALKAIRDHIPYRLQEGLELKETGKGVELNFSGIAVRKYLNEIEGKFTLLQKNNPNDDELPSFADDLKKLITQSKTKEGPEVSVLLGLEERLALMINKHLDLVEKNKQDSLAESPRLKF